MGGCVHDGGFGTSIGCGACNAALAYWLPITPDAKRGGTVRHGTYIGPDEALKGLGALLLETATDPEYILAQFDEPQKVGALAWRWMKYPVVFFEIDA